MGWEGERVGIDRSGRAESGDRQEWEGEGRDRSRIDRGRQEWEGRELG